MHRIAVVMDTEEILYNYVQYECHMSNSLVRIRKITTCHTAEGLIRIGLGVTSPKSTLFTQKVSKFCIFALFYSFCISTSLMYVDFRLRIG